MVKQGRLAVLQGAEQMTQSLFGTWVLVWRRTVARLNMVGAKCPFGESFSVDAAMLKYCSSLVSLSLQNDPKSILGYPQTHTIS